MKLERIYYFADSYFVQGYSWDDLEALYIAFRNESSKSRLQFKEEILRVKKLLQESKHEQIEKWLEAEMSSTSLDRIELIQRFVHIMLPLIEKYEYNPEISYVPLQAFPYMLETYITPQTNVTAFNVWELQQEGDTYIAHLLKDIDYIERMFEQNNTEEIENVLNVSKSIGVYFLESESRAEFLQLLKEGVS